MDPPPPPLPPPWVEGSQGQVPKPESHCGLTGPVYAKHESAHRDNGSFSLKDSGYCAEIELVIWLRSKPALLQRLLQHTHTHTLLASLKFKGSPH